jgi:hypothetical protein
MPKLNADQIKALAPDPASLKAGQGLVGTNHWASLGGSEAALWGECKGSGKEPYKVRVDLSDHGSACTCPSRKFPCKHVLGLMLLASASPARLTETTPPGWVAEWLEKRSAKQQAPTKKVEPKADPEARQAATLKDAARRAAKREKLAEDGLDALDLWLKDLARQGLAFAQSAPASFWEQQAARLVDAQLPGAARLIREMGGLPDSRPDWAEVLLLRLGRMHLLVQAYRKLETLPEASQQDVRSLLGWIVNQDELLAITPGVQDDWLVVASQTDEDEKTGLRTRVNWLWGKSGNKAAQIINFAFRGQPLDASLVPGAALRGELVYFPSAALLRAVFKEKQTVEPVFVPSGFSDLSAFFDAYAATLGKNPWLDVFPAVLEGVVPLQTGQKWLLCDSQKQALPLSTHFSSPWELFALSGGHLLTVFGLWDGFVFLPLAAWDNSRCVDLSGTP